MSASQLIMDAARMDSLRDFCAGFAARYSLQPPEFAHPQTWYRFKNIYERYSASIRSSDWFQRLITDATSADLDAFATLADQDEDGYQFCMIRCLQFALLGAALQRDEALESVSTAIPVWFRGQGWHIPADWVCEVRAANDAYLTRQDAALAAPRSSE